MAFSEEVPLDGSVLICVGCSAEIDLPGHAMSSQDIFCQTCWRKRESFFQWRLQQFDLRAQRSEDPDTHASGA